MSMFVRIKPYDPRKGYKLKQFTARGVRFEERKGWYKVGDEMAMYLKGVHTLPDNPDSPLGFDVHTEAEAKAINEREYKAKVAQGKLSPQDAEEIAPRELRRPVLEADPDTTTPATPARKRRATRAPE